MKVVLLHDVTNEHQRSLELERSLDEHAENIRHIQQSHDMYWEQATRDALTGLLNRRTLYECYADIKEEASSRGARITIAMIDLNDFKGINDRFGHATGDRALQAFGDELRSVCREEDRVFRLGGDEFMILTVSMPEEVLEERLRELGEGPTFMPEIAAANTERVGFSFGIASAEGETSLDELMASADSRLYMLKKQRAQSGRSYSRLPTDFNTQ